MIFLGRQRGLELGYAQITSDFTTAAGPVDAAGLSITVTVGARPIMLEFYSQGLSNSAAGGYGSATLVEGSTVLQRGGFGGAANVTFPGTVRVRLAPSPGSHTYKVQLAAVIAGTAKLQATADGPAFIRAFEV